jgi:hypothetical protein
MVKIKRRQKDRLSKRRSSKRRVYRKTKRMVYKRRRVSNKTNKQRGGMEMKKRIEMKKGIEEIMAWTPEPSDTLGDDPGLYRFILNPSKERASPKAIISGVETRQSECMTSIIVGMHHTEIADRIEDINRLVRWTADNTSAPPDKGLCLILVSNEEGDAESIHTDETISIIGGTKIIQLNNIELNRFNIRDILNNAKKIYDRENEGFTFVNFPEKIDIAISDVSSPAINAYYFTSPFIVCLENNSSIFIRQPINVGEVNAHINKEGRRVGLHLAHRTLPGGQYYQAHLEGFCRFFERFGEVQYIREEDINSENLPLLKNGSTTWEPLASAAASAAADPVAA